MTHSATEITALATRAAVGAGVPHAQARAFGQMVPHHLAQGQGAQPLEDLLTLAQDEPADNAALRLYLLVDRLRGALLTRPDVAGSVSLDLALAAKDAELLPAYLCLVPCRITRLRIAPRDVDTSGRTTGQWAARLTAWSGAAPPLPDRIIPPAALLDQWHVLAWRTYVPASALSRASGAGAGRIDND